MIGEETLTSSEADHLRQQLMRAQRLSSVGTLASSVAHEFNNILTTVINYAKLGLKPESTDASRLQALEKILKGSQRALPSSSAACWGLPATRPPRGNGSTSSPLSKKCLS